MQTSSIFTTWFTSLLYTDKFSPELGNYNVHSTDLFPFLAKSLRLFLPTIHHGQHCYLVRGQSYPFVYFDFRHVIFGESLNQEIGQLTTFSKISAQCVKYGRIFVCL